jgi:hypothetical protein
MLPTSKTNKTPGLVEQKGSPGNWRAILLPPYPHNAGKWDLSLPHVKGRLNANETRS